MKYRCSAKGFTLVELMIVVAIVAILAAIAYPSYINYITRAKRVAAEGCLSVHANYMERYYTTNLRYDQDAVTAVANAVPVVPALDCASTQQTGANYSYDFPTGGASVASYQIEAVPQGAQATRDTKCGTLKLDQMGTRKVTGSGTLAQCW